MMASEKYKGPIPRPDEDTEEFWKAAARHEFLLQKCNQCGKFRFPPWAQCPFCLSDDTAAVRSTGRGKIVSYTVVHRPPSKVFDTGAPYVIALAELDEGVRMTSNVVECRPEDVSIGMEVEVTFVDVSDDAALPKFRPFGKVPK